MCHVTTQGFTMKRKNKEHLQLLTYKYTFLNLHQSDCKRQQQDGDDNMVGHNLFRLPDSNMFGPDTSQCGTL